MRAMKFLMATTALATLFATAAQADMVVSNKATQNVSCVGGVCTATAANAVLNAADLASMLTAGDVAVKTGGGATNIVVKAGFGWTNTSRLTLDANQSVEFDKPVSVTGTGAVTITANDGGSGGDLMFDGKGNIKFWDTGSSLVINGKSYTLVKDIATLASDIAAKPSGFYALANDYDASVDGTYTSAPVSTELAGTFEGLGHKVDRLSIEGSNSGLGLFARASGELRDLQIIRGEIVGNSDAGMLLAVGDGVTIVSCSASGSIVATGNGGAGGLVAGGKGVIDRSHTDVSAKVDGSADVGGLVGTANFIISRSYAAGDVQGGDGASVGGLVGALRTVLDKGEIDQSYASGNAKGGENSFVGGLAGLDGGDIVNSYSSGAAAGGSTGIIGGLAGETGLVNIQSSYSIGRVTGGTTHNSAGGFLGDLGSNTRPSSDYWDTETSGHRKKSGCGGGRCGRGIKGLTTEEFQSGLPAGFDPTIWGEKASINGGFPYLLANPPR